MRRNTRTSICALKFRYKNGRPCGIEPHTLPSPLEKGARGMCPLRPSPLEKGARGMCSWFLPPCGPQKSGEETSPGAPFSKGDGSGEETSPGAPFSKGDLGGKTCQRHCAHRLSRLYRNFSMPFPDLTSPPRFCILLVRYRWREDARSL